MFQMCPWENIILMDVKLNTTPALHLISRKYYTRCLTFALMEIFTEILAKFTKRQDNATQLLIYSKYAANSK